MAWQQIMPVRNNPAGKVLSGAWTVPDGVTEVKVRLIMDQVDVQDPTKEIKISIIDDATQLPLLQSIWRGGFLTRRGTYDPPNFGYYSIGPDYQRRNLGGRVWNFEVEAVEAIRYGAEMELT